MVVDARKFAKYTSLRDICLFLREGRTNFIMFFIPSKPKNARLFPIWFPEILFRIRLFVFKFSSARMSFVQRK